MTRREAIECIAGMFGAFASDRCIGDADHLEIDRELRDSLRALGVADDELPPHLLSLPGDKEIDDAIAAQAAYWRKLSDEQAKG